MVTQNKISQDFIINCYGCHLFYIFIFINNQQSPPYVQISKTNNLYFFLFPIFLNAKTDFNGFINNLSDTKQNDRAIQDYFSLANKKINQPEEAKKLINEAKKITQKIDSKNAWIKFYYEAGKIYSSMNALDLFSDALLNEYQFYKDTNLQRRYLIESELGVLYANLKDEKTAAFYFEKLVQHYATTDQYVRYALAISNLAGQYSTNPKKALELYSQSLEVLKKKPNDELKLILLTNIGKIYLQLNQPAKALDYLNKARILVTSKSDKDVVAIFITLKFIWKIMIVQML
ncbi:MAG: tetratricopeptide repeat protein [Flavobacteriia bacterium]|nr:tetratricopeptide repeat protein [Flavobacteriia bacterium]MBH2024186.1 tetratricopeptide repeat protein [Flavobacteriales bacterium]